MRYTGMYPDLFTSLKLQIFITLVVLADCVVFVWLLYLDVNGEMDQDKDEHFEVFEWIVLSLCLVEALGRLLGFGFHAYCRDLWSIFDGVTIIIALCVASAVVNARLSRVQRLLRRTGWCVRLCRTLCQGRKLSTAAKHKVTQNKSRYVDLAGNFDLDLTYIKKNTTVIAMSVPTDDCIRGLYLNRLADVVRFFETKHSSSFRIYNACWPEYAYPVTGIEKAGGQVVRYQIQDHTPPTMNQFVEFLMDAHKFQQELESAVIAVHCKALFPEAQPGPGT